MPSLKEVKARILSVESTKKITQARQMISSARLHQSQGILEKAQAYSRALESVVASLVDVEKPFASALAEQHEGNTVAVVIMSSNSGMCGAFNAKIVKELPNIVKKHSGKQLVFYPIGKKIREALTEAGYKIQGNFDSLAGRTTFRDVVKLTGELMSLYASKKVSKVDLVYFHNKSTASQVIVHHDFMPYALPKVRSHADCIFEPSRELVQERVLPQMLKAQLYTAVMDNQTSEHTARTLAMQLATENADDMLDDLRLSYNKLRQQNITSELLDIIGGSFA
ncbi:MAG: ATP synthase F1 subunit gamma [Prevotellaceae bacterium]|jgi:F-type H+-transporting ATPase subunit gamma|nr:ATP synthase F1 subunit gamma [Prevotellaceae bacterium]